MKAYDPGHAYELDCISLSSGRLCSHKQCLTFVKRIGDKYPGNDGCAYDGPTTQEVLRALIDRLGYVNSQKYSDYNGSVISMLRESIVLLELRAADELVAESTGDDLRSAAARFDRILDLDCESAIELVPACAVCGHIMCERHA